MKTKMHLLCACLFALSGAAGQELNLEGFVFEQQDGKAAASIPFASVYWYNYEDTTKIEFCAFTNMTGKYQLYNIRNGKYIVKVLAPGYQTKRQEIQFLNVGQLAKNNNNRIFAHIALKKVENIQITPTIFQGKDLLLPDNNTLSDIIQRLKEVVENQNTGEKKSYRIWIAGLDLDTKTYSEIKTLSLKEIAKEFGDKSLKKTYIEYYDLSGENKSLVDGVFNLVFNGQSGKSGKTINNLSETTDFFIKE
ncbi:hypothetical protein FACS189413_17380 [Bacteroidia bacterium]|nr:hypothetical protein FACS189413_17380 [Bacteroidia bacterium]